MADSNISSSNDLSSGGILSWIKEGLENIVSAITSGLSSIHNFLQSIDDTVAEWLVNAVSSVGEFFSDLGTNIGSWFTDLGTNLGNWLSYINPFSENFFGFKLIEMLQNLFVELFVPSQDVVTELQTSITSKFSFIDTIKLAVADIQEMLENIENGTAKLTVDIDSKYYSGEVVFINLNWYSKFKTYGDMVFTGFLYVLFFWRLYKSIPNILAGVSSITSTFTGGSD